MVPTTVTRKSRAWRRRIGVSEYQRKGTAKKWARVLPDRYLPPVVKDSKGRPRRAAGALNFIDSLLCLPLNSQSKVLESRWVGSQSPGGNFLPAGLYFSHI